MYYEHNGLKVKRGNSKIDIDTLILNMGSATDCPSKKLGLCKVCGICYAMKPERMYPGCLPYRRSQEKYWKTHNATQIIIDFEMLFKRHARAFKGIKYFRFNESGDFWSKDCVIKLDMVAAWLLDKYGIKTNGFTARKDLNFDGLSFNVKGSGSSFGNNGYTVARRAKSNAINKLQQSGFVDDLANYVWLCANLAETAPQSLVQNRACVFGIPNYRLVGDIRCGKGS